MSIALEQPITVKEPIEPVKPTSENFSWQKAVAPYQIPDVTKSVWQIINTAVPFIIMVGLMIWSLQFPYWVTFLLGIPTGGLVIRLFIIQHDCGHMAFFKSKRVNEMVGYPLGVFTFTPFHYWRHNHAVHHATSGDLDRRGGGDVWTVTVKEYLEMSWKKQLIYRVYRHPLFLLLIGPIIYFGIINRFVVDPKMRKREKRSVYITDLGILAIAILASLTIGFKEYLMIQIPIVFVSSTLGVWLFYVQHQFEGTYWEHQPEWDYVTACLIGSSFYKLPRIFQWFSGNIGFHHIHHLSPKIPNYYLEQCHNEVPQFQEIEPITFIPSLKSINFRLWDEENNCLVGFDVAAQRRREQQ